MGFFFSINDRDRTNDVDLTDFQFEDTTDDRIPEITLTLDDDLLFPIEVTEEVLIIDTGITALQNPTQNILVNPLLDQGTQGLNSYGLNTRTNTTINAGPPLQIVLNNMTVDGSNNGLPTYNFVGIYQIVQVIENQTYSFSTHIATHSLVNASVTLWLGFFQNGQDQTKAHYAYSSISGVTGTQRITVTNSALSGDVYAVIFAGITISSSTNSGYASFSSLQLEAHTFKNQGVIYPTPDCNYQVPGCILLPDLTTCRQTRLFYGVISVIQPDPDQIEMSIGQEEIPRARRNITCRGAAYLLETKFVNGIFNGLDSTLITAQINAILPNQIDTTNVIQGITVSSRICADQTFIEFIQGFADTSGYIFYVGPYLDLHYEPLGYNNPNFSLSDNPDNVTSFGYHDWKPSTDATQIGNRVTVNGGQFTGTYEDSFTANGSTKAFILTQRRPVEVINVQVNGVEQTKGISGNSQTTFATYQALVDFPNHQVLFENNVTTGQTVYVKYVYDGTIREQVVDLQSIAKFQRRNFDGIFDRKVNDTNITTSDAAKQRGISELSTYAYGLLQPTFGTFQPLKAGQTVQITSAQEGYDAQPFLVHKVDLTLKGNGIVEYTCEVGSDLPTFSRMFRQLHKAINRYKKLPGDPFTSINLIAHESITYIGDSLQASQQNKTCWTYGSADALYGYSSYCTTYTPPSSAGFTYGAVNSIYGQSTYS